MKLPKLVNCYVVTRYYRDLLILLLIKKSVMMVMVYLAMVVILVVPLKLAMNVLNLVNHVYVPLHIIWKLHQVNVKNVITLV